MAKRGVPYGIPFLCGAPGDTRLYDYVEMMGKGTFINEPLVHFKTLPSALIISVGRYKIVTKTD